MAHALPKTINSSRQMREVAEYLAARCEVMAQILQRTGVPPQRDFPASFAGIAKIIVGQQLSAQSANAIWGRLSAALHPLSPQKILEATDEALREPGLSTGKIRTLRALSLAVLENNLDIEALRFADEQHIIDTLTTVSGIGPWTADIYLLFALRRKDAFAAGDLALQIAAQHHFKLKARPTPAKLLEIAERWRPARAVAAQLLWADYALLRREGALAKLKPVVTKSRKLLK